MHANNFSIDLFIYLYQQYAIAERWQRQNVKSHGFYFINALELWLSYVWYPDTRHAFHTEQKNNQFVRKIISHKLR